VGVADDDGTAGVHDISVELRVEEHVAALNALLSILCLQIGFSANTFSFDEHQGGIKTATEVVSENDFFDYDAKYNGQVKEITPARIPEETAKRVAEITSHIYDILHCNGIIRIDYIISKDQQISMLEINTTPGMTPTSFIPQQVRAAGLEMKDVLTDIVENQF
jgi:D-alanine-D-alanine ligase-like ATP-grasp enzyme